jgi:hypothetical protein
MLDCSRANARKRFPEPDASQLTIRSIFAAYLMVWSYPAVYDLMSVISHIYARGGGIQRTVPDPPVQRMTLILSHGIKEALLKFDWFKRLSHCQGEYRN